MIWMHYEQFRFVGWRFKPGEDPRLVGLLLQGLPIIWILIRQLRILQDSTVKRESKRIRAAIIYISNSWNQLYAVMERIISWEVLHNTLQQEEGLEYWNEKVLRSRSVHINPIIVKENLLWRVCRVTIPLNDIVPTRNMGCNWGIMGSLSNVY